MSLKILVLCFFVAGLCYIAWFRSWFTALCGAIVLLAVLQHPEMPRSIAGIQGFNIWNILFLNVAMAWFIQRSREGLSWDMPQWLQVAFVLYFAVVIFSSLRLVLGSSPFIHETRSTLLMNTLINPIKFFIPCLLLFDGCRTRQRVFLATGCIVLVYFLFSVQVCKNMGFSFGMGDDLADKSARIINRDVGFHRVDMSMMLAGGSWALLAFSRFFNSLAIRVLLFGSAGVIIMGQVLTAGRGGYLAWLATGLLLCTMRWKKILYLIPVAVLTILIASPGFRERALTGLGKSQGPIVVASDSTEATAGRSDIWPHVINQIFETPFIGNGREGMKTTGLTDFAARVLNDTFGHPHNAYLEMLLDNGFVGLFCVFPLFFIAWTRSLSLFLDGSDRVYEVAGGVALSLLTALLVASLSAQTLYPREGVVPMWAAIGIALRVYQERRLAWLASLRSDTLPEDLRYAAA